MQMVHGLAAVFAGVGDNAVTARAEAFADLGCGLKEPRDLRAIGLRREFGQVFGVFGWDHEHVVRRLRVEIVESDDVIVAQHFVCRDFFSDDLTKQTIGHDFGFISSQ
jgi:hypothetical protein